MSDKPFIAELHDIGKLVNWDSPDLKGRVKPCSPRHSFHDFDFPQLGISHPTSPSWWGQFTEEVGSLATTKVPKDLASDVLLTGIADEMAATISRTRGKKGEVVTGLHVLWDPDYYKRETARGLEWAAVTAKADLVELFRFIDTCSTPEEFFERYGANLRLTAEDKSAPFNITNLLTHLELAGKIYRVLKRHSKFNPETTGLVYNGSEIQQASEATGGHISEPKQKGKWQYRLVFARVQFPQSLVRLRDLNIFKNRSELIKGLLEDMITRDYVLFSTDDFMCLFLPKEEEVRIQEILKPLLQSGFIVEYREMEAELNLLTSSMEDAFKTFRRLATSRHLRLQEKRETAILGAQIQPPLCDSCQLRKGQERVREDIREYLCDTCYDVRNMGEPAREYATWHEMGVRAAWMKITLDQDHLLRVIRKLFENYVDTHPAMRGVNSDDKNKLKESFRPLAVQMDFVKDYKLLLGAFRDKIYDTRDGQGEPLFARASFLYPIDGYYEFCMFQVCSGTDILKVLDLFCDLLENHFPECMTDSPIKLSLSVAHVKYPYQAHWRFLSSPEMSFNLQCPGSVKLNIDLEQYRLLREKLRTEDVRLNHFLHRLAAIEAETNSQMNVILEVLERRKRFPVFLELIQRGLSIGQVLDFHRLTSQEVIRGSTG